MWCGVRTCAPIIGSFFGVSGRHQFADSLTRLLADSCAISAISAISAIKNKIPYPPYRLIRGGEDLTGFHDRRWPEGRLRMGTASLPEGRLRKPVRSGAWRGKGGGWQNRPTIER